MRILFNFLLLLYCFYIPIYSVSGLSSDGISLLSLMRHWTSVPPSVQLSWNASDSTPCSWIGVTCGKNHNFVVALNLSNYQISGPLGPEIAHLSHLTSIDFSSNDFTGSIPSELGNLQNLRFLSLFSNSLMGAIPESLFRIPHLETLWLNLNKLNGSIPSNVGNMSEIISLYLYGNQLSGAIPFSIGNCSTLEELILTDNQLSGTLPGSLNNLENLVYLDVSNNILGGTIPLGLGGCRQLETLVLSFNQFIGGIPPELGNCSSLTRLAAVHCGLTGPIPPSFGLLTEMELLYLNENSLSGAIPPELGKCKSLSDLQLYGNQLEGEIPSELGFLSGLKNLWLFTNRLTGEIPISIWKIQSLENLLVYNNSLSGELPPEISELTQLRNISLFNNQFSGVIPQSLGVNCNLTQVDFTGNSFTGKIPPNLCSRKQLRKLLLGVNRLEGSIPSDVGSCSSLTRLILKENNLTGVLPEFVKIPNFSFMDLSNNFLTGVIPSSFSNLTNITLINLSMNRLTGPIPPELGGLVYLQGLNLSHNRLEGSLPSELSNCTELLHLDVGYNSLDGSIPSSLRSLKGLNTLTLSGNRFTGGVPPFLFQSTTLLSIQLGGNLLGGNIPSSIGAIQAAQYLQELNLSANGLTGHLPAGIANLAMLEQLDISCNNLTGTLAHIGELESLVEVNVSHNSFSGPIPDELMKFLNSSPSLFLGNQGLCVNCLRSGDLTCIGSSNFRNCNPSPKGVSRKLEIAMIAIGSLLSVVFLLLVLGYVFVWRRRPTQEVESYAEEGAFATLINKIMEATDNLHERYIIGRGAHGTVYKAAIPDKVYAVKKLVFAGLRGGNTNMVREIETVGKVRHRNLIKLEDFWLRKEYGLILYEYMENGSLHDVLHELKPSPNLEWSVRYKIALGTAHGLAYLHHDCDPAIVHRDIKPMNILLDSDMEPHISDFGIAKLLDQSSASTSSSTVPGTIGYIAPENVFTTTKSKESDVYSYGVVLLELITRKKALDPSFSEEVDMVGWVRSVWNNTEEIERIVDPILKDEFLDSSVMEQVIDVLFVALRCTEKEPRKRPTMRVVVKQLVDANVTTRSKPY
ncbi:hypothetical protein Vadar_021637 [Vaccinium darrowii]|uniref:Uncharacterized protein n=1 Tax=Vaccinium darrowii TaxID=229202 RepID=A0ACB7ZKX6_9ERIC|nr:hypothetical protein Vadar_021637 [Vaccinium darrowii]